MDTCVVFTDVFTLDATAELTLPFVAVVGMG
jgi:hypothetical protein